MKSIMSKFLLVVVGLTLVLAGCSSDNTGGNLSGTNPYVNADGTPVVYAKFDGIALPLPNDAAWGDNHGVCPDGQVCLPLNPGETPTDGGMGTLKTVINGQGLLGLSPNMFLTMPVTGAVQLSNLHLLVFRLDDPNLVTLLQAMSATPAPDFATAGAAFAALEKYTEASFIVSATDKMIKLVPRLPLSPGARYAVVVQSGLLDQNGNPVQSSLTMEALKQQTPFSADSPFINFEKLRAAYNDPSAEGPGLFDITLAVTTVMNTLNNGNVYTPGWGRAETLDLWAFHTAATTLALPTATGFSNLAYPGVAGSTDPTFADVTHDFYLGALGYNLSGSTMQWTDPNGVDPVGLYAQLGLLPPTSLGRVYFGTFGSPKLESLPTGTPVTESVPFLLAVPAGAVPTGGFPVVLFQHGIGRSKEDALAIADTLAAVGYATIAIDAPFHGGRAQPGQEFFTANLLQDRLNIYQAAFDLWETVNLVQSGALDFDPTYTGGDVNTGSVQFVAHSLGSIIGSVFLSQEVTRVNRMVLSSPSAVLVNVLDDTGLSDLQALVASLGYIKGTSPYYTFLDLAQWLLDPVDGAYNGIGSDLARRSNLLTLMASGDPIVSNASTEAFSITVGVDAITTVDPSAPVVAPLAAGTYLYGKAGYPIVHSFLLNPSIADPLYQGYDPDAQVNAYMAAQAQVAGFLLP